MDQKKSDHHFHSKHVKHDPNAENARAAFGLQNKDDDK